MSELQTKSRAAQTESWQRDGKADSERESLISEKEAEGSVNKRTYYQKQEKTTSLHGYTVSFTFEMTFFCFSDFYSLCFLFLIDI